MAAMTEKEATVDPFLVEALQNPRHRLTILRMELDIQKFFQNPEQLQFEFSPFPTSYLRLAAHRVAQHYGLVTMALDTGTGAGDGSENRILVTKTAESRFPYVCLSEIPVKQPENGRPEGVKIAIKARPKRGSGCDGSGSGVQQNLLRSVEERKEEYDKARARIFNSPSSSDSEDSSSLRAPPPLEGKHICINRNETEVAVANSNPPVDAVNRESGRTSRVAIIRDREKDRYDPDYDRSYDRYVADPAYRYVRVMPSGQSFNPMPMHIPFHDGIFPPMPRGHQVNLNYGHPLHPALSPFTTNPAGYTPWPNSPAMNYVQSLNGSDTNLFRHPSASNP
uniref:R3H domain-containing protein 1 n=1 Tax=Noccaea caerulescens TaxID=107243 RepID=A0A1J3DTU5_NOCCA